MHINRIYALYKMHIYFFSLYIYIYILQRVILVLVYSSISFNTSIDLL